MSPGGAVVTPAQPRPEKREAETEVGEKEGGQIPIQKLKKKPRVLVDALPPPTEKCMWSDGDDDAWA